VLFLQNDEFAGICCRPFFFLAPDLLFFLFTILWMMSSARGGRHLLCRNASGFYVVGCTDIKQDLPVGDKRVYYISSPLRNPDAAAAAAAAVTVPARFFQKSLSDGRIIVWLLRAQEMKYISIYSSLSGCLYIFMGVVPLLCFSIAALECTRF
jgi:hypothetical protein